MKNHNGLTLEECLKQTFFGGVWELILAPCRTPLNFIIYGMIMTDSDIPSLKKEKDLSDLKNCIFADLIYIVVCYSVMISTIYSIYTGWL